MPGFRVCSKRGLVGKTTSKRHEHTGINIDVYVMFVRGKKAINLKKTFKEFQINLL